MKKLSAVLVLVFLAFLSPLAWAIEKIAGLELAGNITKATDGGDGKFYLSTGWTSNDKGLFIELLFDGKSLIQSRTFTDDYPIISFDFYDSEGERFFYLLRENTYSNVGGVYIENLDWSTSRPFISTTANYEILSIGQDRIAVFDNCNYEKDDYMRIFDLTNPRDPDLGYGYCYDVLLAGHVQKAKMDEAREGYLYVAYEGESSEEFNFFKYVTRDGCPQKQMTLFLASNHPASYPVEVKDFVVEGNQIWLLFYDKNYWSGGILRFEYDFDSEPLYALDRVSYGLYDSDPNCIYFDGRMQSMTKIGDKFFVAKGPDGFCVVEELEITQDFPDVPADEIIWIGGERQEILVVFENKVSVYALAESLEPPKPPKRKADISAAIMLLIGDE